jgi:hypothetical protein
MIMWDFPLQDEVDVHASFEGDDGEDGKDDDEGEIFLPKKHNGQKSVDKKGEKGENLYPFHGVKLNQPDPKLS